MKNQKNRILGVLLCLGFTPFVWANGDSFSKTEATPSARAPTKFVAKPYNPRPKWSVQRIYKPAKKSAKKVYRPAIPKSSGWIPKQTYSGIVLDPRQVEEGRVNVMFQSAPLKTIVSALAPAGWKVVIETNRAEIKEGFWNFYSSTQRREALTDLLTPMGMVYRLFPDFKDHKGRPAPVLLVGDAHSVAGHSDQAVE